MAEDPAFGLEYSPNGFEPLPPGLPPRKELASSTNFDMAVGALSTYASGGVAGRSCLIAGARGSGKTTLIDRAFDDVRRKYQEDVKLVRVRLHGPSLFKPQRPAPTPDNPSPAEDSLDVHVLKELVKNLYQTAAEEVANSFQGYAHYRRKDGNELAAQLRLTLDGAPSAATLRFFWERAGALPGGVLFPGRAPAVRTKDEQLPLDQGVSEIVALATAADAYRTCTGKYTQEQKNEQLAGEKAEAKTEISASGKELSKALIGLASGVAAGATAAALTQSKVTTALAGAITTVLSMVTLSYTRTRSRETTMKEEITFLPDTTASGLIHRVLLLLRRLRQAGLLPIFIIDELDKVPNLITPLTQLTSSLKFLFADEGFFCFLTDRTLFASVGQLNRRQTNTPLKTIFTNQMLIRYDTSAIHQYLQKVIRADGRATDDIKTGLEADREAFRYIMICRSRMLPFELSRDLASLSGTDTRLNLAFEAPRKTLGHQCHLAIQLAIELVLTDKYVADRISRDESFAQTIYDALYYPVNLWYADERTVDCSHASLKGKISEIVGEDLVLEATDEDFIHTQVKAVMEFLSNLPDLEEQLREAFRTKRLGVPNKLLGPLIDAIPNKLLGPLLDAIPKEITLLKRIGETDQYQWQYNRSGITYEASKIQEIRDDRNLWNAYRTIDSVVGSLTEIDAIALAQKEAHDAN